jgi:hypothetical protein
MGKMFQIHEEDLAELERLLPAIADRMTCAPDLLNNAMRMKLRRVQEIISHVRWNYGPPSEVRIIPCDDKEPPHA